MMPQSLRKPARRSDTSPGRGHPADYCPAAGSAGRQPGGAHFYQVVLQDGRLFGSPIDILNRAAPVALLAIGMTLVIATGGIDLSVGAVMAIAGATAASMTVAGHSLPVVLLAALAAGALAGLWNGILVAVLKIQPFVATLILMVAGRGVAQSDHRRADRHL